jgi:hypothetical protein
LSPPTESTSITNKLFYESDRNVKMSNLDIASICDPDDNDIWGSTALFIQSAFDPLQADSSETERLLLSAADTADGEGQTQTGFTTREAQGPTPGWDWSIGLLELDRTVVEIGARGNACVHGGGVDRALGTGVDMPNGDDVDELHSSLSVYFRISAPFADDHVIGSHATYVT